MMIRLGMIGLVLVCVVGCQPWASPEEYDNGLVLVLPGVGGGAMTTTVCDGLEAGDVDYAIEMVSWTSPWGVLDSLQNETRNRREAQKIADRVVAYQTEFPGRPVFIVGHSGGGGIAVWSAEALPEDCMVDGIVLVAPALSPTYDLTDAISRSKGGLVNFHSELDWVILGAGTRAHGTIDREYVDSAGMVGFVETDPSGNTYTKFYQVPWTVHSIEKGHLGGHATSASVWLIQEDVAPLVRENFSDESLQALRRKVFASQAGTAW